VTKPALDVRDLRVWYATDADPVRAVDGVSLQVFPGAMVGLVGESGCGKSTLGRSILGLLPAASAVSGEVNVDGRNIVDLSQRDLRRLRGPGVGLIFQEPMTRLNPLMRINEQMEEVLKTHEPSLPREEVRRRSREALAMVGIPPSRARQYPDEFSGGMRQRIMIALGIVLRPAVLVADEPTTALDVIVEAQILAILADLCERYDTALLLITHNLGVIAESCDRVAVMYAGKIVEEGPVRDVLAQPLHPYTQALLQSTIALDTTELHHIPGAPPDLSQPPPGCRFHPRCPNAMRVCAERPPVGQESQPSHSVSCWLHGPADLIPPDGGQPLALGPIADAEES
jgi:oligopeptide/dipeptide ABC transporter ATP-binding protein